MRSAALSLLFLACGLLAACQTMTPEERRAADENRCLSYGFRRGTDSFATCLQRIDLHRQSEASAEQRDVMRDLDWRMRGPSYVVIRERSHAP